MPEKTKRPYKKKNLDYWNKRLGKETPSNTPKVSHSVSFGEDWEPMGDDSPNLFNSNLSKARRNNSTGTTGSRFNQVFVDSKDARYHNIDQLNMPFSTTKHGITMRKAIELTQKAYANISIVRNTIDIMSEFANSEMYLEGGTKQSREFVKSWLKRINIESLKDQFFREFYRSGNVFLYRINAKFSLEEIAQISKIYNVKSLNIPIRYLLLNPYEISLYHSSSFHNGNYQKALSQYELERLRDPKTDRDQQIFDALPKETQRQIKEGTWLDDGLYIELDPEKIRYSFYKKQDYEPFGVPFVYPVLDDINWKLELKKIDQAICRTVEQIVLLITMGNEPEKGGVNPKHIKAMQSLFLNQSVGRVLVSDYTTKADFVIPDLKKVLGKEKYEIVNEDIKEGLQNIILGTGSSSEGKFANQMIKTKIFLERIKEPRANFKTFIQQEIDDICEQAGFQKSPTAEFQEMNLKDENVVNRVAQRLMELGILTPETGIEFLKTGVYPTKEKLEESQKEFLQQREEGLYNPIVGGTPVGKEENGVAGGAKKPPISSSGRPSELAQKSSASKKEVLYKKDIADVVFAISELEKYGKEKYKQNQAKKRITKKDQKFIDHMVESVVASSENKDWHKNIEKVSKDINLLTSFDTNPEIYNIAEKYNENIFNSAIIYHSKKFHNKDK